MESNLQKEQFSQAYVRAVAAAAGCATYELSADSHSVDLGMAYHDEAGVAPRLEAQLKCTAQPSLDDTHLHFPLTLKNYNELRGTGWLTPRILIVVIVPEQVQDWMRQTEEELSMRRCGYWASLKALGPTDNSTSVTIHLPRNQLLTVAALQNLMRQIQQGGRP